MSVTSEQVRTNLDVDALKYVLSLPRGRKLIWGLLGLAGVFRQPFNQDLRLTDFNCGSLNLGLALYADCLQASPELTAMMTKEQANVDRYELERKRTADASSDHASGGSPGSPSSTGQRDASGSGSSPSSSDDPFFDRLGFGRAGEDRRD